jgi:phosphotransferase system HPr (HPr) family protein
MLLVRVDDKLLHGQVMGAWVPSLGASLLIVASDEVAGDSFRTSVMRACAEQDLDVVVSPVANVVSGISAGTLDGARAIIVVSSINDAWRLYEQGLSFPGLNIGNVHHKEGGRKMCLSVILDPEDEELIERFEKAGVSIDIRDLPTREPVEYVARCAETSGSQDSGLVERDFTITNRLGLHARAASRFVQISNKFDSEIFITKDGQEVNGKSIMGILILAATCGSVVTLKAEGSDARSAVDTLGDLIKRGFDEENL